VKAADKGPVAVVRDSVEDDTDPVDRHADLNDPVLSVATVSLARGELSPVFPRSVVRLKWLPFVSSLPGPLSS
jgi:hypothetical protein